MKKQIAIFFVLCLCVSTSLQAQKRGKYTKLKANLPYFENSRMHFGFTLGTNTAGANIDYSLAQPDSLISIEPAAQSGFNIGIVSSLRFTDHLTLRFLPTLAFAQRNFNYAFEGPVQNTSAQRIVESTYLLFPLTFKFRSARYNNFAVYLIGGGTYGFDLSSQFDANNERPPAEQVLKFQRQNIFADVGMGFDFFLEYFKFSIEFKYSHGLTDALIQDNSFWSSPIQRVTPKMFGISLHFEG